MSIFARYDWEMNMSYIHARHPNCSDAYEDRYIPMIWGKKALTNMNISTEAPFILGFNEPNHYEQSNITAKEAAELWWELEEKSRGRPLVSPAASRCTHEGCHGDATDWFDEFFANCQGCRVDYLATHLYKCNPETVMDYLQMLYQRYGLQIWLTEFACPYTSSPQEELDYMQRIIPRLDAAEFVYR